ncbi:PAS domain S-box protein [Halosolutus gelatinilyticus]|uniref:PAS domain S-box protein n=1 Tax=Halosolutus gelatinilyticus TaxID=2931975 RepID=UPI001FF6EE08|nr:PAS domain S-box protein [Halosolutus gelatinilyticus]
MSRQTDNEPITGRIQGSSVDETALLRPDDAQLLRALLGASPVAAVAVTDAGSIAFANAAVSDVLGYQPSDVVGESLAAFVVDEHRSRVRPVDGCWIDDREQIELNVRHEEGRDVSISIDVCEFELDGQRFFAGYLRENTAAGEYERAINRYEAIAEMAGDGVYQLDPDSRFEMVSDTFVEMTGYSRDDLLGAHASVLLDEAAISRREDEIEDLLGRGGDGRSTSVEFVVRTADGEAVPVEERITPLCSDDETHGTVGVVRDVSERRERVEELRQERELIEHILETSPVGIGVITPDGDISRVNDRAEDLLGLTMEEITNQTLDVSQRKLYDSEGQQVPPEDLLSRVFDEGRQVLNSEFTLERPDGDRVWAALGIAPMTGDAGDVEKAVVIATDITDRKEREETLREERDVIEHVLETSPVGIGVITPDGDISRVNDRAEELFGLTDYELSNRTLDVSQRKLYDSVGRQVAPEDLLSRVFDNGERVLDTEFEFGQPDGDRIWLSISIAPIPGPAGDVQKAVIIGKDVTDRKEREETLREERELIERILETSPVGIGVITPDGDISRVNDRAGDLLGLTMEEITNQTLDVSQRKLYGAQGQRVAPEDLLSRVFDEGKQVLNSEFTLERPDGDRVWAALGIAPMTGGARDVQKAVVIATDISDRKERERRLRESEARLRQIAENINSAIWMADADMSEVMYINPAYEEITGRSRDSVYDNLMNHVDAVYPQDQQRVENAVKRATRTPRSKDGALRFQEKYRIVRPDGSTRWVNNFAFPLRDENDEVYRFVGVIDDITGVKEQQIELGRHRDELETLNQINTVIRRVNQGLVQATNREEIEETVCKTLTDSKLYHAAWTGEADGGVNGVEPKTGTGIDVDALETTFSSDEIDPIATAVESGDIQIIRSFEDLGAELAVGDSGDVGLRDSGQPFAAVIPLVYKETVYDVLVAYSSRANAFSAREQAVLLELGKTIGLAINAVERKKALLTDAVQELTFEIQDREQFFVRASDETGAEFEMEGITSQSDGSYLQYFTVMGTSPERVLELADEDPFVERTRLVNDHEDAFLIELVVTSSSPASTLAEYGASVHTATFADGGGTITSDLPQTADTRAAVEAVKSRFSDSELASKRKRERSVQTCREFQAALEEALSDRQRAALAAAYYAGFFEWPRDSSGEEVAESLGVAPATFHQHFRAGEKKLVKALVDGAEIP